MKNKILVHSVIIFIISVSVQLIGFYLLNLLSRNIDLLVYSKTMLVYFLALDFASLGLFSATSNKVSKLNDKEVLKLTGGGIVGFLCIGIVIFVSILILNIVKFKETDYFNIFLILSVGVSLMPTTTFLKGVNQGKLKPYIVLLGDILQKIILFSGFILAIKLKKETIIYYAHSLGIFLNLIYFMIITKKRRGKFPYQILLKGLLILPFVLLLPLFNIVDLLTYKSLEITDSVFYLYNFQAIRMLSFPLSFLVLLSGLYLPYLNRKKKEFPVYYLTILTFIIYILIFLFKDKLYALMYNNLDGIELFNNLLIGFFFLSLIKLYLVEIIRKRHILVSSIFILSIVLKLIFNYSFISSGISVVIQSFNLTIFILFLVVVIALGKNRSNERLEIIKSFIFISVFFMINFFLRNVLLINFFINGFSFSLILTIIISPFIGLVLKK